MTEYLWYRGDALCKALRRKCVLVIFLSREERKAQGERHAGTHARRDIHVKQL